MFGIRLMLIGKQDVSTIEERYRDKPDHMKWPFNISTQKGTQL